MSAINHTGLSCPRCGGGLAHLSGSALSCERCRTSYPSLDGVPWLFAEPMLMLGEWQNRLRLFVEEFRQEATLVDNELARTLSDAGRARLQLLSRAYIDQVDRVARLLGPLNMAPVPAASATLKGLGVELPRSQDLHSYYANLHRDWCWGDEENGLALTAVTSVLPPAPIRRLLVLGAGAARLAYDLHQSERVESTVCVDINPLLVLTARAVAAGQCVELYEFPIAPRADADIAVLRKLRAPAPARHGLEFVFADAFQLPFPPAQSDAVLTPWLADIVENDFSELAAVVNRQLTMGGHWIFHGSASFTARSPSARYGLGELTEHVLAAGFSAPQWLETEMPYMRSPASRHSRREIVLTFGVAKLAEAATFSGKSAARPWLADPRVPIPVTNETEVAAIAARIQAFSLSLINGERSAADIASFIVEQKLLDPASALAAVRGLLVRLDSAQRRTGPA